MVAGSHRGADRSRRHERNAGDGKPDAFGRPHDLGLGNPARLGQDESVRQGERPRQPFKTAITMKFMREWPFVISAAGIANPFNAGPRPSSCSTKPGGIRAEGKAGSKYYCDQDAENEQQFHRGPRLLLDCLKAPTGSVTVGAVFRVDGRRLRECAQVSRQGPLASLQRHERVPARR